jgi:hypothetical protein
VVRLDSPKNRGRRILHFQERETVPPEPSMIRILVIASIVVLGWLLLLGLAKKVKGRGIDWKGWALFVGFIALAFYLNHVTGIG